jgi:hypothetical protein
LTDEEVDAQTKFVAAQTTKLQDKAKKGELSKDDADDVVLALFNTKKVTKFDKKTTTTTTTTDANGKTTTSSVTTTQTTTTVTQ